MSKEWLIAILSAGFGVLVTWYYSGSPSTRIPTFLIDPARAQLAGGSGAETSDISILYKGNPIGQKAVNVVRIYFWNAGNTPIIEAAKDILEPFTITTSGDSEILDAKVLRVNRKLTTITFEKDHQNTATVNFRLLEPNDGAALQITYAGPKDAKLEFHGATIGAPSPTINVVTDYYKKISDGLSPLEKVVSKNEYLVSFLFSGLVLSVIFTIFNQFVRNFVYRRLFMSQKTDQDIEDSARRLLCPAMLILIPIGLSLIGTIPPQVTGAIPSALIVKD